MRLWARGGSESGGIVGFMESMSDVALYLEDIFFFFSSRRRHTIFDCDWSSDVCSSDLILAPRLNAAGRIGDANDGLRLLLSDDPQEAAAIARELETLNARRQALDQRILDEAVELAERVLRPEDRALVLAADAWHPGVIGIVASRLVERYGRPTFLIAWDEGSDVGRGSGRSVGGFDLHAALHRRAA